MTSLPIWAVYAVAFGTPLAAFLGVAAGHVVTRKGAAELDVWRRREETMRMLRWASEQAVSADPSVTALGLATLEALVASELLQPPDRHFIKAVTATLMGRSVGAISAYIESDVEPMEEQP